MELILGTLPFFLLGIAQGAAMLLEEEEDRLGEAIGVMGSFYYIYLLFMSPIVFIIAGTVAWYVGKETLWGYIGLHVDDYK